MNVWIQYTFLVTFASGFLPLGFFAFSVGYYLLLKLKFLSIVLGKYHRRKRQLLTFSKNEVLLDLFTFLVKSADKEIYSIFYGFSIP